MFGGTSNPQATTFLISRQRLIKINALELSPINLGVRLLVNGKPWPIPTKNESTPEEKAKVVLKTLGFSELFFNLVHAEINKPIERFWTYDISAGLQFPMESMKIEFPRNEPRFEGNPISQVVISNLGHYGERNIKIFLKSGKKIMKDTYFKTDNIPTSSIFSGVNVVSVNHDGDLNFVLCFNGTKINIPYEKILTDRSETGLVKNDSQYRRASIAIECAWRLALGMSTPVLA